MELFENDLESDQRSFKTLALRFTVDVKHFENSLSFSKTLTSNSNTYRKWPVIAWPMLH